MAIEKLHTIDSEGNKEIFFFENNIEIEEGLYKYHIFMNATDVANNQGVFFQFYIDRISESEIRVDTMARNGHKEFTAKGIPDAMIQYLRTKHKARIYSSSNSPEHKRKENESRNKFASKVWRRLLLKGEVSFCENSFRYYTFDKPVPANELNIGFDNCQSCGFSIPIIDIDAKIDHIIECHVSERIDEDKTPIDFAKRLFHTSKGQKKRQSLFNLYTKNLNLLIDNGLIEREKDKYICPICLEVHFSVDTESNPLTLEDAPPKSLGGKANTLTCEECNGHCGRTIDHHLTERLRELDSANFIPGTKTSVKVNINGEYFQSTIAVDENSIMTMEHSRKNNNPSKLEPAMTKLKGGQIIDMNFLNSKVIPDNLEIALLKTGYMLAFERFGYSLMLDPCFDIVRKQILHPEQRAYPEGFWTRQPFDEKYNGVHFVVDEDLESLLVIFQLDTGLSKSTFSVFLPLPCISIIKVIDNLKKSFDSEGQLALSLSPRFDTKTNYLTDIGQINQMKSWIKKRELS